MEKIKTPYTVAETLINPCLIKCVGILLDERAKLQIQQDFLSNDTVKSRIVNMACDVKSQLIEDIKASPVFEIQLDGSFDCENFSPFMVFFWYVKNKQLKKTFFLAAHWK